MADSGLSQLHRILLEALPLAICVVNREGRVLLWSSGAEKMTGYFRQEVLGRPFPENLHQENEQEGAARASQFTPLLETLREVRPILPTFPFARRVANSFLPDCKPSCCATTPAR